MERLFNVPLELDSMYLRGRGEKNGRGIILHTGEKVSTDTYFGCYPCEPYNENTTIKEVRCGISIRGSGKIELRNLGKSGDRVVGEIGYNAEEVYYLSASLSDNISGCLYIVVYAEDETEVSDIWFEGEGEEQETSITVIICTYRREEYVKKNLEQLCRTIEAEQLQNYVDILCVDNGGTLEPVPAGVRLIKNRNYGGSGGYARGMIEAEGTYFWMMDDDIRFEPAIIRKAVTFMKYRKNNDIRLAAGMFSFEEPTVQQEATAVFNGYTFTSNASGLDFRERRALLNNRIEQNINNYGGWWSLIMPVSDTLPMPFFIKLDDVEYGIRTGGKYVTMNGFGVWHEAFGKKGNAWTEYYTTRNTMITQVLHPGLPHSAVKMMGIRLLKAVAYGEPKCMEAAYKGVEDYVAGAETFRNTNPEENHRKVMGSFRAPLMQDMSRKKMVKLAVRNMLIPKNWRSVVLFLKSVWLLRKRNDPGWSKFSTLEFWQDYLGV